MITIKNNSLRRLLRILIPVIIIPAVIIIGIIFFDEKQFLFISITLCILSLLFFITGFESKKTGGRRLVITSVMTALSVAGRFIPFFKPVTALTVITAIYFGGEAGFLVGALSAFISNFYFGQGPWTPFQMFSWGLIGLFAGLLSNLLRKNQIILLSYRVLSGIFYSLTMDVWTVIWYNGAPTLSLYLVSVTAGLPHMILYCVSNLIFLTIAARPFGKKLSRIKTKYDI